MADCPNCEKMREALETDHELIHDGLGGFECARGCRACALKSTALASPHPEPSHKTSRKCDKRDAVVDAANKWGAVFSLEESTVEAQLSADDELLRALSALKSSEPPKPDTRIEWPKEGEVIASNACTFKLAAPEPAETVEVCIDGAPWQMCRYSAGYWWFDWTGYWDGEHEAVIRARVDRNYCISTRRFAVKSSEPAKACEGIKKGLRCGPCVEAGRECQEPAKAGECQKRGYHGPYFGTGRECLICGAVMGQDPNPKPPSDAKD